MIEFLKSLLWPQAKLIACKFKVCPNCKFRVLGNVNSCKTCGFNLKGTELETGLTSGLKNEPLNSNASDHFDTVESMSIAQKAELI